MMRRRSSSVASLTSRSVGARPCSHQKSKMNARTCLARSENSKVGTFCGIDAETKWGSGGSGNLRVEDDLVVLVGHPDPAGLVERHRGHHPDVGGLRAA